MRYLLLLCFLFFSGFSYAILPSESTDTSIPTAKEETKSKKEIKKQQKIDRKADKKEKRQLKKQTQKLKWQLLKNAFKAQKANKKLNTQNKKDKKDRKPVYKASRLSALFGILGNIFFGIAVGISGIFFIGALLAAPFGITALIFAVKSLRFISANPKEENDSYNRTWSIILTIVGMYFAIPITSIFIISLLMPFLFVA